MVSPSEIHRQSSKKKKRFDVEVDMQKNNKTQEEKRKQVKNENQQPISSSLETLCIYGTNIHSMFPSEM